MDVTSAISAALAEATPPRTLVRLANVQKVYGSGLNTFQALYDVNLEVATGEILAICGPSGAGKTSLLNLVALLDTPSEGSVIIDNMTTAGASEQARADLRHKMIGCVFQASTLIPVLTAKENVLLPLMLRGHLDDAALATAKAWAAELLARVGLTTQAHHYPERLDPCQCQRVAIARALVGQPRLVVADEPTARLDHGSVRLIMDLFAAEQRQHGTTFVISTRDQRQLNRVTRTVQLHDGRLAQPATDTRRTALRAQR